MSDENKGNNYRIYEKLDVLDMRLDSMDKTLIKQEINLKEHIRRTEAVENQLEIMKKEMTPVQKHVAMVEGAFKFLGIISMTLGVVGSILKIFEVI
jgi:hypothetical protein